MKEFNKKRKISTEEVDYFNRDIERISKGQLDKNEVERLLKKDHLLTDITHLLTLPQKIAAAKLGINETILCKRFRQATNRKWPYRYLSKLEREIEECDSEEEKKRICSYRN